MNIKKRYSKWLLALVAFIIISIPVVGCTIVENNPPIISGMYADKTWVEPLGNCQIECIATDPENNELTYEWSATGGNIIGIGSIVSWSAPEARGIYIITVVVSDSSGGETRMDLPTLVSLNNDPVIDNLTAAETGCGGTDVVPIDCIAYDPDGDELSYEWSATGGTLSADGALAVWTAPEEYDYYYITVIVTDGRGGKAEDEVHVRVGEATGGG
jgi:hypothetical protein